MESIRTLICSPSQNISSSIWRQVAHSRPRRVGVHTLPSGQSGSPAPHAGSCCVVGNRLDRK